MRALAGAAFQDFIGEFRQRLALEHVVVQLMRRRSVANRRGHRGQRQQGTRGAYNQGGPHLAGVVENRLQFFPHMGFERRNLARLGRIGLEKALRQPHHAEFETLLPLDLVAFALDDLDAAAADIDHQRPLAAEIDRVAGRRENQPRLLRAGDDVDMQAELFPRLQYELAAVDRLAHRAGRHRQNRIRALARRQALESGESF
jgi:hypothetical protein